MDTVGAVVAGSAVVVAPFARDALLPRGRVVARWVDGEPAAIERPLGGGCVREIAIAVPGIGDLALRESLRRLLAALAEPCGGVRRLTALSDSAMAVLRGGSALLATRSLPEERTGGGRLATGLLAGAAILVLAEPLARRGRRGREG